MPISPIYTSNNVEKFHKRIYFQNFTNTLKHKHHNNSSKVFMSVVFPNRGLEVTPIQFNSISASSSIRIFEMERMIDCRMLTVSLIQPLICPPTIRDHQVLGSIHVSIRPRSVLDVLSGTATIKQRPDSCSTLPKSHYPSTK